MVSVWKSYLRQGQEIRLPVFRETSSSFRFSDKITMYVLVFYFSCVRGSVRLSNRAGILSAIDLVIFAPIFADDGITSNVF